MCIVTDPGRESVYRYLLGRCYTPRPPASIYQPHPSPIQTNHFSPTLWSRIGIKDWDQGSGSRIAIKDHRASFDMYIFVFTCICILLNTYGGFVTCGLVGLVLDRAGAGTCLPFANQLLPLRSSQNLFFFLVWNIYQKLQGESREFLMHIMHDRIQWLDQIMLKSKTSSTTASTWEIYLNPASAPLLQSNRCQVSKVKCQLTGGTVWPSGGTVNWVKVMILVGSNCHPQSHVSSDRHKTQIWEEFSGHRGPLSISSLKIPSLVHWGDQVNGGTNWLGG